MVETTPETIVMTNLLKQCEDCKRWSNATAYQGCRTQYHHEYPCKKHDECKEHPDTMGMACAEDTDPNKGAWLCPPCAVDYHAMWDELWSMYYSQLM